MNRHQRSLLFSVFIAFFTILTPPVLALTYSASSDEHFYTVDESIGYYQNGNNVGVNILKVAQEDCSGGYPCARSTVSDVTVQNGTTDVGGVVLVNITRTSNWPERGHFAALQLNDSSVSGELLNNSAVWFWVYLG